MNLPSICLPAAAATACAIVGLAKGVVVNAAVAADPNWGRAAYWAVSAAASDPAVPGETKSGGQSIKIWRFVEGSFLLFLEKRVKCPFQRVKKTSCNKKTQKKEQSEEDE